MGRRCRDRCVSDDSLAVEHVISLVLTTHYRHPQGSPWPGMVYRIFTRRQALRHWLRGRNYQDVEELRGVLWALAGWPGWPWRCWRRRPWCHRIGRGGIAPSPFQQLQSQQLIGSLIIGLPLGGCPKDGFLKAFNVHIQWRWASRTALREASMQ